MMVSSKFEQNFGLSEKNRKNFWKKFALEFFADICGKKQDKFWNRLDLGFTVSLLNLLERFRDAEKIAKNRFFREKIEF